MEKRDVLGVLSNSEFITVRPIDLLRFVEELPRPAPAEIIAPRVEAAIGITIQI